MQTGHTLPDDQWEINAGHSLHCPEQTQAELSSILPLESEMLPKGEAELLKPAIL